MELLIVIAIIGTLASVVVGSLSTARNKAENAKVKSNLSSLRNQAELYFTLNGNYGPDFTLGDCPTSGASFFYADPTAREAILSSSLNGAVQCVADDGVAGVGSSATSWAVQAPLSNGDPWCVDASGFAGEANASLVDNQAICQAS